MSVCPACGSDDVEDVPGRGAYGNQTRRPRTIICFACRAISENHPTGGGDREWIEVNPEREVGRGA